MTFKRFLRLCSPSALYRPPRTLINMDTPYPRTPWVTPSRRVSTPPLWTSRNPNLLVGVNLDIGSAVNKELHIKVILKNQIGSNLLSLVHTCPDWLKLVQTCPVLSKLVQIGPKLSKPASRSKLSHRERREQRASLQGNF
jgi:hypothetical protein